MYDVSGVSSIAIVGSCWNKFDWFVEQKITLLRGLFYDAVNNWDNTVPRLGWPENKWSTNVWKKAFEVDPATALNGLRRAIKTRVNRPMEHASNSTAATRFCSVRTRTLFQKMTRPRCVNNPLYISQYTVYTTLYYMLIRRQFSAFYKL